MIGAAASADFSVEKALELDVDVLVVTLGFYDKIRESGIIDTLEKAVSAKPYIAGDKFTAADLLLGSTIGFMLNFNMLDPRPAFTDYAARTTDRDAYRRAQEIDGKQIAEIQAKQAEAQPA